MKKFGSLLTLSITLIVSTCMAFAHTAMAMQPSEKNFEDHTASLISHTTNQTQSSGCYHCQKLKADPATCNSTQQAINQQNNTPFPKLPTPDKTPPQYNSNPTLLDYQNQRPSYPEFPDSTLKQIQKTILRI